MSVPLFSTDVIPGFDWQVNKPRWIESTGDDARGSALARKAEDLQANAVVGVRRTRIGATGVQAFDFIGTAITVDQGHLDQLLAGPPYPQSDRGF